MTKYVKAHTKYILDKLSNNDITSELLQYHRTQISYIQHERLIHLLVTFLFSLLLVGSTVYLLISPSLPALLLFTCLLVCEVFYIAHYFLLENTVQKWYKMDNSMASVLNGIGTNIYTYK